jgi:hypothetical protein
MSQEDLLQKAFVDLVDGKAAECIAGLQKRFNHSPGPLAAAHIMVFADEAGDITSRDSVIRRVPGLTDTDATLIDFIRALASAYRRGPKISLNLKSIDQMAAASEPSDRILIDYLTARYANKRGQKEVAVEYIKRCYFGFGEYCADDLLVDRFARDLGLNPMDLMYPTIRPLK